MTAKTLPSRSPLAVSVVEAIRTGDVGRLGQLLADDAGLATARIRDDDGSIRTLAHIATDWPGHFPGVARTIRLLAEAGAPIDDQSHPGTETPLHWAASSDDVEAIDALIESGADIDAPGAVIAGGTPLDDAVAFGQWQAARRLVEHGARTALKHAAALGLMDRIEADLAGGRPPASPHPWGVGGPTPPPDELTVAFWCACHGGQQEAATYLLERGAHRNWIATWDGHTPLDTAVREGADHVATWLRAHGGRSAQDTGGRARWYTTTVLVDAQGRTHIPVPFDPDETWGPKPRHHVAGALNGYGLRAVVDREDDRYVLVLGPSWGRGCGPVDGSEAEVFLEPEGPQRGDLAPDVAAALDAAPEAAAFFDSLAQFYRRAYLRWIDATKRHPEQRPIRIAEMIRFLEEGRKERP
jgi:uncharacterized protein